MDSKVITFEKFAQQAAKRMEERKKHRTEQLRLKDMDDMVLEIRALSDKEISECYEFSDDSLKIDQYTIYCASKTLQETAKVLVANGQLKPGQEYKITEMFTVTERNYIAKRVLTLSGVLGDAGIEVIKETEEIKNS
ncbi:MAG: hypothetical protein K2P41_10095 [Lachnospiraceae bacterium]|nr:hypothetical protein [Lachnospiraceae bacterium]